MEGDWRLSSAAASRISSQGGTHQVGAGSQFANEIYIGERSAVRDCYDNMLNIKTPALDQAKALKADYSLSNHGLSNLGNPVDWNLVTEAIMRR